LWASLNEHRPATLLRDKSGGRASVQALAFSEDGKFVAAAYSEPSVLLYKLETGASVTIAAASPARSLAFSNRGTMLAVGLESGGIDLRTVPGGVQIESAQKVHRNAAGNVTFTRNDALLASHAVVGDGAEAAITVVPVPSLQPSRAFIARPISARSNAD
jgi:WD40 repeat protein